MKKNLADIINKVHCADCLDFMRDMPDGCVDCVITSPPYNVGLDYGEYKDKVDVAEFESGIGDVLRETYRISQESARAYWIVGDKMLWWIRNKAEEAGWKYAQMLVWCKPNLIKSGGAISGDWNYMTETILLFRKGTRIPMMNGVGRTFNWFVETSPQSNFKDGRFHPAQWPLSLIVKILSRTPADIVFDPFLGSGTTAVAAKQLGRNFIGVEINSEYCKIAEERLKQEVLPFNQPKAEPQKTPDLFEAEK